MAIPSRPIDQRLVITSKKETAYNTAVPDASLIAATTGFRFSPDKEVSGQPMRKFWTDEVLAMRGTDWATQRIEVERDMQIAAAFPGDTWLLAWAAAFAMGAITSTQPNAAGNPTAWKHVIKPLVPATAGKLMPSTTVYVEDAQTANLQRRILGCVVKDFSLSFGKSAPIQLAVNLIGSGQITSGALGTPPALSVLNLLLSNNLQVLYGAQGAPPDISAQIVAGSAKLSFTWTPDDANARAPLGGLYRSRMWVGKPAITLSFQRFVDDAASTPQDDWLAETIQEVQLNLAGATIGTGPETHLLNVRGLAVRPTVVKLGVAGDKTVYDYTFGPGDWLEQGAADVFVVTVQNLQSASYLN